MSFLLYLLSRILFFLANRNYFPGTGTLQVMRDCFYGLRFDAFSIVVSNSLFILLSLLPVKLFRTRGYQRFLFILFMISNTVFLAANFIDVGYFEFTRKRSSADLFSQLGGQSDMGKLLPRFLADFWWILALFVLGILLMAHLYRKLKMPPAEPRRHQLLRQNVAIAIVFLLSVGLSVLAVRGGLQRVPIDIVNAGSVTRAEEVPIVLNTPFTLIKSVNQQALKELNFYTAGDLKKTFQPVHLYEGTGLRRENIVVLILESFSKEYTRLGRMREMTPFLDSLMDHSLVFRNAFSNGTKSIEGIPAILSGLPSLMDNPFINSIYANNYQTSFPTILREEGFSSAFFHGGINGTMNFNDWAALAGYDHYYGRNEYMNDEHFDGYWGIWDEPFLQFSIQKMNEMPQPFHSAIFTLSSHHPYFVPKELKHRFKKGELDNAASIRYADYSLRRFFETARKMRWYSNTLFVLVADHCGISNHPFYSNAVGNLSIPILFYKPDHSLRGTYDKTFSQVDILPSVLSLQGYNKPFFSFGMRPDEAPDHQSYFYSEGSHFVYTDSLVYIFNRSTPVSAFNYKRDSLTVLNILHQHPVTDSLVTRKFKAFLQTYHATLIGNSATVKKSFPG